MTPTKNVLIVEDEPLIAMMIESFLEALDRDVAGTADTVSGALEIIREGGVDVAILDRNLRGGETSVPIAEELSRLGIPFVIASGGGLSEDPVVFKGRPVLSKPFSLSGMEEVLDAL